MLKTVARFTVCITAVLLSLLVSGTVSAYLYSANYTAVESNGTAYGMTGWWANSPNTYLASHGFMASSGNDTRIQNAGGLNYPTMLSDNRTFTACTLDAFGQVNLKMVTGLTPQTFDIITGPGGYVTKSDNATLEMSNNGTIHLDNAYINTSVSGNLCIYKPLALASYTDGNSVVATIVDSASTQNQTSFDAGITLSSASFQMVGQRVDASSYPWWGITSVQLYLSKAGAPAGTAYCRVRAVSDNSSLGTLGTVNVAGLGGGAAWVTFNTSSAVFARQDIRITLEYSGGGAGDYITWHYQTGGAITGEQASTYATGVWTDTVHDFCFQSLTYYGEAKSVSVTGATLPSDYTLQLDGTDMTLTIGGSSNSTALGGVSVPNTSYDWYIFGTTVPYTGSYKHYVGGNLRLWYEPESMIIGTTMPDRVGGQDGVITWGTIPAGVAASIGAMVGADTYYGSTTTTSRDILPTVTAPDLDVPVGVPAALLTNPLRPLVIILSDTTTLTELQAWRFLGIAFVLFVTVATGMAIRKHLLMASIVCALSIIMCIIFSVFPWYAIFFAAVVVSGGLVSERTPSV